MILPQIIRDSFSIVELKDLIKQIFLEESKYPFAWCLHIHAHKHTHQHKHISHPPHLFIPHTHHSSENIKFLSIWLATSGD